MSAFTAAAWLLGLLLSPLSAYKIKGFDDREHHNHVARPRSDGLRGTAVGRNVTALLHHKGPAAGAARRAAKGKPKVAPPDTQEDAAKLLRPVGAASIAPSHPQHAETSPVRHAQASTRKDSLDTHTPATTRSVHAMYKATCASYTCLTTGWVKKKGVKDLLAPEEVKCCEAASTTSTEKSNQVPAVAVREAPKRDEAAKAKEAAAAAAARAAVKAAKAAATQPKHVEPTSTESSARVMPAAAKLLKHAEAPAAAPKVAPPAITKPGAPPAPPAIVPPGSPAAAPPSLSPAPAAALEEKPWYLKGMPPAPPPPTGEEMPLMDEDEGVPEHGFKGRTVQHDDKKTITSDWRDEYGKKSVAMICDEHPTSSWCKGVVPKRSGAATPCLMGSLALAMLGVVWTA